jgi:small subunit ribosomal protein S20
MAKEKEEKKKEKRPTAIKRDLQSQKRNLANRAFKATVGTALRSLEQKLKQGDTSSVKESLNKVFSLVDKGVKKGRYKMNKASRIKSRLHKRALKIT